MGNSPWLPLVARCWRGTVLRYSSDGFVIHRATSWMAEPHEVRNEVEQASSVSGKVAKTEEKYVSFPTFRSFSESFSGSERISKEN